MDGSRFAGHRRFHHNQVGERTCPARDEAPPARNAVRPTSLTTAWFDETTFATDGHLFSRLHTLSPPGGRSTLHKNGYLCTIFPDKCTLLVVITHPSLATTQV